MAIPVILGVEIVKQLFKFGGSFRKEAIGLAMTPAVIAVYNSMELVCSESCSIREAIFAPTAMEWSALITASIALFVHLNAKRKDGDITGE